jgi:hypothetical protein
VLVKSPSAACLSFRNEPKDHNPGKRIHLAELADAFTH